MSGVLAVLRPKASTTVFAVSPLSALPVCSRSFARSKFPSPPGGSINELVSNPVLSTIPKFEVVIFLSVPPSSIRIKSTSEASVVVVAASELAVVITVPATAGNVTVTSAVFAGPIKVTLLVPLSLSSKNSINPAEVAAFFTDSPALNISFAVDVDIPTCAVVPKVPVLIQEL
jgi:hypothetical protein